MFTKKSDAEQTPPAACMRTNSSAGTRDAATNERLEEFIRYFVKESEAKLYTYHLVLEGELQRSGKFTKAFSEAIGLGIGGSAGILGAVLGIPAEGAKLLSQAGKSLGEIACSKIGNESYAKHVRQLADLVKLSQECKATFRKTLVETGFDIFQSFEMQFMGVSVNESSSDAMHALAKDAISRAVSYLKNNKSASVPEAILLGESKRKDLVSFSPGFSVTYKNHSLKEEWNTGNLYSKVGLLTMKDGKSHFFRKKESNTGKYGYRRLLNQEKWDVLSKVYIRDNIAESKSGHFTDYEYSLHLKDMKVKCESILQKINLNDKDLSEDRIKELLEEAKKDILEEIKILKKQSQVCPEDSKILEKLEECVNNFSSEEHLKKLKQLFEETTEEVTKLIKESSEFVVEHIQNMSNDNMEQHRTTHAELGTLKEGMETVLKEQKQSKQNLKQFSQDLVDGVGKVNKNVETLMRQQRMRDMDPIWFDMRDGIESFTGRKNHLSQIAEYAQKGMVVITGLSGVGKSELAIQYARTQRNRYSSVIWINANNREIMKQSFCGLYERLGFKIDDESATEKNIRSIAEDVYCHFSRQKCLFIFDDAESYATIKDALPRGLPPHANKPHVLITSQKLEVERGKTLPLGDFSINESVDFIKTFYNVEGDAEIDEIRELAQKLHNFPLALQQAIAYISEEDKILKNVDPEKGFTIRDYLEEFDRESEDLLKSEVLQKLGNDYDKTTYTAIQITLNKIRNQKGSQQALDILHTMAYFSTENIPASFFLESGNEDERKLGAIIQLLKDYSIVSGQGRLNIHALVQQVIRSELAKELKGTPTAEETVLRRILELLMKYMTDYPTIRKYIPHIISVWNHAVKYNALLETFIVNYLNDSVPYTTHFHVVMESSPFKIVTRVIEKIEENCPEELDKVINQGCSDGATPLYRAAMSGDERKVTLLLRKGANIDVKTKRKFRLLHVAAKNGYKDTVQDLLRKGVNVDPQTEYNFTPLHFAVKGKHLETVNFLLAQGADVTMKSNRGFTPLHFAVITGRVDIVETLLNYKAAVTDKTGHQYTPLHLAAKDGYVEILNVLLQSGADVEAKTRLKFTPLHFASEKGHLAIVEALLGKKAEVNVKDRNHFRPLHLAALYGRPDVVFELLKHGADVNAKTAKDNTPLHFASQKGHFEVVRALISNKAELDIRNKEGKTALDLAVEGNFVEIKNHIIQHVAE